MRFYLTCHVNSGGNVTIEHEPKTRTRSQTLSCKQMSREHRKMRSRGELLHIIDSSRPRTRNQCQNMPRPCLYVSCRHHLYLDINVDTGSVKYNFPNKEVWELEETCALDVAERGGATLEEIGDIMNLTRERVRQLETDGLKNLEMHQAKKSDEGLEPFKNFNLENPDADSSF